jgi:NADH-quinone oxidoreductase subunit F
MDETVFMPDVVKNLFEFYHHESCGQCTPCREGVGWGDKLMGKILDGHGTKKDLDTLMDLSFILNGKTICVFAPSVAFIIDSYIGKFRDEFYSLVK